MRYIWAIILGLLVATQAGASETWVTVNLASKHWPASNSYNEHNRGLGLHWTAENGHGIMVGNYRNSFDKTSSYVGWLIPTWQAKVQGWKTTSNIGFVGVSGYGSDEWERVHFKAKVLPIFTVRHPSERVGIIAMGFPGLLLGLGVEIKLP